MRLIRFFLMLALLLCCSAVLTLGCSQIELEEIKNIIAINKNEVEKIEFYKKINIRLSLNQMTLVKL